MAQIWSGSITILDAKGATATLKIHMSAPDVIVSPADDPAKFLEELAWMIDGLIDGKVINLYISRGIPMTLYTKTTPVPGADVEQGVSIVWRTETNATVKNTIPTWSEAALQVDGSVYYIDAVYQLLGMFTEGVGETRFWNVRASSARGELIESYGDFEEKFKRSRRD